MEVIAFLDSSNDIEISKHRDTSTINAIKLKSLSMDKSTYKTGDTIKVIMELDTATSEKIVMRVTESDNDILHQEVVTTDDFGIATSSFVVDSKYYFKSEATVFFEAEPDELYTETAKIELTRHKVVFSSPKEIPDPKEGWKRFEITATWIPPISNHSFAVRVTGHSSTYDIYQSPDSVAGIPYYGRDGTKLKTDSAGQVTFYLSVQENRLPVTAYVSKTDSVMRSEISVGK